MPPKPKKDTRKGARTTRGGNEARETSGTSRNNENSESEESAAPTPAIQEGSREWLEQQRETYLKALTDATKAAEIPDFDRHLREYNHTKYGDRQTPETRKRKLDACKAVGNADSFNSHNRFNRHYQRMRATSFYEDFLYYQYPSRRGQYEKHIDKMNKGAEVNPFRKGQEPGRLWGGPDDGSYQDPELRKIITSFEENNVGMLESTEEYRAGPLELHTRVPVPRRRHVGLGAESNTEKHPIPELDLDEDAIVASMVEADARGPRSSSREAEFQDADGDGREVELSHADRRAQELEQLGTRMPSESYVHDLIPTAHNLDRTRLKCGLFIAAGETSDDWLTSYDQHDIVKPGYIAVEKDLIFSKASSAIDPTGDDASDVENTDGLQKTGSGRLSEFWEEKQPHKDYQLVLSTKFAETAYGRREREHANMHLAPSSPVTSPPQSPKHWVSSDQGTMQIPVDISREDERRFEKYKQEFRDHYGVDFRQWPVFRNNKYPNGRGFTVQYEAVDVAALPDNLQVRYQTHPDRTVDPSLVADPELLDEKGCFKDPAPKGTSMRLLRIAKNEPYRAPIKSGDPDGGDDDDDGDSDYDGDLFRQSYLEASAGGGGGAGNGSPGDGGNEGEGNEEGE